MFYETSQLSYSLYLVCAQLCLSCRYRLRFPLQCLLGYFFTGELSTSTLNRRGLWFSPWLWWYALSLCVNLFYLSDLVAPILPCSKCFRTHWLSECPCICITNQPCAYVPFSFSTFPCLQCIKIEETGVAPEDFIEPSIRWYAGSVYRHGYTEF